jgi:hypothetical protein
VSILNIFLEGGESIKATPRNKSLKTDFFFVGLLASLLPSGGLKVSLGEKDTRTRTASRRWFVMFPSGAAK